MDWGSSMYLDNGHELFVVAISLIFTYFVFEQNNSILNQLKDLKTRIIKVKKHKGFFEKYFIIPYFEDRFKAARISVYISYITFSVCILVYFLNLDIRFLSLCLVVALVWIVLNFSLDNDVLPIYKALVDSKDLPEFLKQLDIDEKSDEFKKISKLYREASSAKKVDKEIIKLIKRAFDELPKI